MILKIALYVLISILIIVALGVIIWRIVNRNKIQVQVNKTKIGHVSKKMVEQTEFFAKSNNVATLVNLLVKNTFSKKGFSLIPALFVTNKKVYVLTDLINSKDYQKIIIKDQKYNSIIGIKKNKEFPIDNFNLTWYKEIMKLVEKHVDNCELIIVLDNNNCQVINDSEFKVLTFPEFENYLNEETQSSSLKDLNKKQVIQKFQAMNRWQKGKNGV